MACFVTSVQKQKLIDIMQKKVKNSFSFQQKNEKRKLTCQYLLCQFAGKEETCSHKVCGFGSLLCQNRFYTLQKLILGHY